MVKQKTVSEKKNVSDQKEKEPLKKQQTSNDRQNGPPGSQNNGENKKNQVKLVDSELDADFLQMVDLVDMDIEHLEMSLERIDMATFDAFHFDQILNDNSLQFMVYKLFQFHNINNYANIKLETLVGFTREMALGYFKENPYHNVVHILDSL